MVLKLPGVITQKQAGIQDKNTFEKIEAKEIVARESLIAGDTAESLNRVGIGTTDPQAHIHIVKDFLGSFRVDTYGDNMFGSILQLRKGRGTFLNKSNTQVGDIMGEISIRGYRNGLFIGHNAIRFYWDGFDTVPLTRMVLSTSSTERLRIDKDGNFGFNLQSFGGGEKIISIANASTVPSSNPAGGGIIYCEAGALKYRGSSGTITTIANA